MVVEVGIFIEDSKGKIWYDTNLKKIELERGDLPIQIGNQVISYLTSKREFKIPESRRIDDYRIDKAYPYENLTYFELAMSTLWANTGVFVDWSTEKRTGE